ncbi:MAG: GTP cyclohydrolase I, partial [Clostridia bacterium]|nr:GTP cyclohydrolase I [Clostridia bacterium]
MDRKKAMKAIEDLLEALGEDVSREGLKDTPRRVADAFAEFTAGENMSAKDALSTTFAVDGGDMVIEKDISFSSTCE